MTTDWYVSPDGVGNGSLVNPFNLQTAVAFGLIRGGDTVWIAGGTYTGDFICSLSGKINSPIKYKPIPGEHVVIDGLWKTTGSYIWLDGSGGTIEMFDSQYVNRLADTPNTKRTGFNSPSGTGNKLINCLLHDLYIGFVGADNAIETEYYGNVVYFCGDMTGLGHGCYPQNTTGVKRVSNNIFGMQFGYNIHAFGSSGLLNNIVVEDNICFDSNLLQTATQYWSQNILIGGAAGAVNPEISRNFCYLSTLKENSGINIQVGYGVGNVVENAIISDNFSANEPPTLYDYDSALAMIDCIPSQFSENALYGRASGYNQVDYPNNTYGVSGTAPAFVKINNNVYDNNRMHVGVLNPSQSDTVLVDVSGVLFVGDIVHLHNVQDYFVDIQILTVSESYTLTVDMQAVNRTVATPLGWTTPPTTFPKFGAFALKRV